MSIKGKMKRFLPILMCAALTASAFAGCGGGSDSSTAAPESSAPVSSEAAGSQEPASETPAEGDANILRYGTSSVKGLFNPIMHDNVYDGYIDDMLFEHLVEYNAEATYIPELATWELINDNATYRFTLKDGIKFSDGTPMTTEDVAFTYQTIAHPDYNGPRGSAVDKLVGYEAYHKGETDVFEGIQIVDEKVIDFTFAEGNIGPANIGNFVYGIMPRHYYEFSTWEEFLALVEKPLGSGLLVMDAYEPNQYVDLKKNENYWDSSVNLQIDGVLVSNVPDESLLGAMQTGQIDFCQPGANPQNLEAFSALDNVTPNVFVGNGYTFMCFNTTRETLADVRVRQALMYALDRETFIGAEYGSDLASVGLAPFSPVSWAFPDGGDLNPYAYDLEKAAALMDEAGWTLGADGIREKNGQKMSLTWLVYTEATWPGTLSGMAADSWKQLGVDLNIELLDFNTVADRTMDAEPGQKDFDIYTMGFSLDAEPDPSGALFDADAYVAGGFNASGYRSERAQELIRLGRTEFDQARRQEYYNEFAKLMNEEIPTIIVAYRSEIWAINDRVSGMNNSSFWTWVQCLPEITLS